MWGQLEEGLHPKNIEDDAMCSQSLPRISMRKIGIPDDDRQWTENAKSLKKIRILARVDNNPKKVFSVAKPRIYAQISNLKKAKTFQVKTLPVREQPKVQTSVYGLDPKRFWIPKPYGSAGTIIPSHLWFKPKKTVKK